MELRTKFHSYYAITRTHSTASQELSMHISSYSFYLPSVRASEELATESIRNEIF